MANDPTILVIDDEEEICGFLQDLLTGEGYEVFTATDPQKGLQMVEELRPDIVILDLKMPTMDGIEVLRRIKKIDEAIAVVIATGFGAMDSAKAAMRLGAFDYITKPFDLPHVKALVKDAIAHRIGGFMEQLKPAKGFLTKNESDFLDSISKCRPAGACVWEAAVRAFLLADTQFADSWLKQAHIPEKDKKAFLRLRRILIDLKRRTRGKGKG